MIILGLMIFFSYPVQLNIYLKTFYNIFIKVLSKYFIFTFRKLFCDLLKSFWMENIDLIDEQIVLICYRPLPCLGLL